MKKILTLVCLCVFLAPVSQAQGNKAFNVLKRIGQKAGESLSKVQQRAMAQVERVRAQHKVPVYSKREVFTKMPHALVQVIGMNKGGLRSTGFILEDFKHGRSRLWAVVPYHVGGGKGKPIRLRLLDAAGKIHNYDLKIAAGGGWGPNAIDASLVRLPKELAGKVTALRLAPEPARAGMNAFSFGYTVFHTEQLKPVALMRNIKNVTGFRMMGDYRFIEDPSGFCGSPVLDAEGYVLGVHSGTVGMESSMAVTADGIRQLIRAYDTGRGAMAVRVFGREAMQIETTESISSISLYRHGSWIYSVALNHLYTPFSYAHAEAAFGPIELRKGDTLVFHIVEHGTPTRSVSYTIPQ